VDWEIARAILCEGARRERQRLTELLDGEIDGCGLDGRAASGGYGDGVGAGGEGAGGWSVGVYSAAAATVENAEGGEREEQGQDVPAAPAARQKEDQEAGQADGNSWSDATAADARAIGRLLSADGLAYVCGGGDGEDGRPGGPAWDNGGRSEETDRARGQAAGTSEGNGRVEISGWSYGEGNGT